MGTSPFSDEQPIKRKSFVIVPLAEPVMRAILIRVPAMFAASPALPPAPVPSPLLTDQAMADQLGRVAGVLTGS